MSAELDYDLTRDQWDALKELRLPAPRRGRINRTAIDALIGFELAAISDHGAAITPKGRSVLLRGSPLLLDVVA
jgi:hypothetical protein